jgi:hypothetical protein
MSLISALKIIVGFLELNKIPYMVIGGVANSIYGEPRQTFDVDIKINITESIKMEDLLSKIKENSEIMVSSPKEFIKETNVLPVLIDNTKVDLIFANLDFEKTAINNSIKMKFEGIDIFISRPEDLIIQKCVSHREKDWIDIKGIIKANRNNLDENYILLHCKELSDWLKNSDLLDKITSYLNEK